MLNVTRKPDERIQIGDDIEVVVKRVRSDGSVVLGIVAPREVPVRRLEKGGISATPLVESEQSH